MGRNGFCNDARAMTNDSHVPANPDDRPVPSAADCCWTQMPQDDCRQFDGKPIEFFIKAEGNYLEGTGTLDTFRHPSQPGLCRLGIVERNAQTIAFYLFHFKHDVPWLENHVRERQWIELGKAERFLRQAPLHGIVAQARRLLRAR